MAVLAPMPRARARTATAVKPGFLRRRRKPKTRSRQRLRMGAPSCGCVIRGTRFLLGLDDGEGGLVWLVGEKRRGDEVYGRASWGAAVLRPYMAWASERYGAERLVSGSRR